MIWILRSTNSEVTDYYIETVRCALAAAGFETQNVAAEDVEDCVKGRSRSGDWFLSSNAMEACRISSWGGRNIILWCQGIIPEESYLRNGSRIKEAALCLIEKRALRKASFCLFVSEEMKRHYEAKYGLDFEGRCFVMPCFNSVLEPESFRVGGKYGSPTFAYVGSMAAWQRFEETVDLYKALESQLEGSSLKVLTFDQRKACEILESKCVERYEIGCVPPEKVVHELADVAYGFVIREDIAVNRVATPTKLSSYMAAGVIPVFSECIGSFSDLARGLRFAVPVAGPGDVDALVERCSAPIRWEDVLDEYSRVFDTYYSRDYYVKRLTTLLGAVVAKDGRA